MSFPHFPRCNDHRREQMMLFIENRAIYYISMKQHFTEYDVDKNGADFLLLFRFNYLFGISAHWPLSSESLKVHVTCCFLANLSFLTKIYSRVYLNSGFFFWRKPTSSNCSNTCGFWFHRKLYQWFGGKRKKSASFQPKFICNTHVLTYIFYKFIIYSRKESAEKWMALP